MKGATREARDIKGGWIWIIQRRLRGRGREKKNVRAEIERMGLGKCHSDRWTENGMERKWKWGRHRQV